MNFWGFFFLFVPLKLWISWPSLKTILINCGKYMLKNWHLYSAFQSRSMINLFFYLVVLWLSLMFSGFIRHMLYISVRFISIIFYVNLCHILFKISIAILCKCKQLLYIDILLCNCSKIMLTFLWIFFSSTSYEFNLIIFQFL